MDIILEFGKMIFDIGLVGFFIFIIFVNLPLGKLFNAFKGLLIAVIIWFIARTLNLPMTEASVGQVVQFGLLGMIIMYPREFRMLLENIGRRKIFSWNTNKLIEKESRKELSEAVVELARNRQGGIIVVAREDGLEDEALSGDYIGEMEIKKEFLTALMNNENETSKGALIIRDDRIIATNVKLPMLRNKALEDNGAGKRHLAGLGIVNERDCAVIVLSAETGAISFMGKKDGKLVVEFASFLKDVSPNDGIDEDDIEHKLFELLKGTDEKKPKKEAKPKKEKPVKHKKEREPKRKK